MPVDTGAVQEQLRPALEWLLFSDDAQPEGALISHHGIHCTTRFPREPVGRILVHVAPSGAQGLPVVVFDLIDVPWDRAEMRWTHPFTDEEVESLCTAVDELADVNEAWNGAGHTSYSVGLARRASAGPLGLVATYRAGCPAEDHGHRAGTVFCDEGWCREGRLRARLPDGWW